MGNVVYFIELLFIPLIAFIIIYLKSNSKGHICMKTGYDIARELLDANGLNNMYIVEVKGKFGDHYDLDQKVVRLSTNVYNGNSVYANIMALYIAMKAIFNNGKQDYYLKIKNSLNGIIIFFTYIVIFIFLIGMFLSEQIVTFSILLLLLIYLYYLFCMYGTYMIVTQIKKIEFSDKQEVCKSLWLLYFWDFASMIINLLSIITNFTSGMKNKR